jgi:D-galactose 1-dehydrogenase
MTRTKSPSSASARSPSTSTSPRSTPAPIGSWRPRSAASGHVEGIPAFTDFATFLAERPDIPVVSLCLPPVPRFAYAEAALKAGRHVMLEKPPGATLAEVHALEAMARPRASPSTPPGTAAWPMPSPRQKPGSSRQDRPPSPHHLARGCAQMAPRPGLGVPARRHGRLRPRHQRPLDPDRNPAPPVHLTKRHAGVPVEPPDPHRRPADLLEQRHRRFRLASGGPADLGHHRPDRQGHLALRMGGNVLEIDGKPAAGENTIMGEYPALYARMADLVRRNRPMSTSPRWSMSPTP